MSNFSDVSKLYLKHGLVEKDLSSAPRLIPSKIAMFRLAALLEELEELEEGYHEQDLPKIADSLIDLVVFALGTAVLHNLPWEDLFAEVQRANMSKVAQFSQLKERNGTGSIDLTKPKDWRPPDIEQVLKDHGWVSPNTTPGYEGKIDL